jgi:hypothetical protein
MSDRKKVWNEWFNLSVHTTRFAWEAQKVIGLRPIGIAAGGDRGYSEPQRMITEKIATGEAQAAGTAAAFAGGDGHRVTKKVMAVYKRRVRKNARRLRSS